MSATFYDVIVDDDDDDDEDDDDDDDDDDDVAKVKVADHLGVGSLR